MKDKGDSEEVQEEVAEDYEDLGYPKLQVLIFVEYSSVVGVDAYDIITEVYCHVSCVYLYPSPRWLIVVFVILFSPFPPKVKFCQSFRTRCLCGTLTRLNNRNNYCCFSSSVHGEIYPVFGRRQRTQTSQKLPTNFAQTSHKHLCKP